VDLRDYRARIDEVDEELLRLFRERMNISGEIAQYKKKKGIPIQDPARESEKLAVMCEKAGEEMQPYAHKLWSTLFELSRTYQESLQNFESEKGNVALIGMPGCGKSTIGRVLAQAMGRPFVDTDERIEAITGCRIQDILAKEGEEVFRRLETKVLGEEAGKSSMVIATGGGVVTRPENRDLLRQNSLIVYLKRELGELVTDGRPLSKGKGIKALAKQRLPLYEAWSDYIIPVEADPVKTTARILDEIGITRAFRLP
jgi:shikimate dehydrogenase